MTRPGLAAPLATTRKHAEVIEKIIRERTAGADISGLPFPALHDFQRKLSSALKRRRRDDRLLLWKLTRAEVDSAFEYLILFTRPDVPEDFLSNLQGEAVCDFIVDLAEVVMRRRGRPPVKGQDAVDRINALRAGSPAALDERHVRRLKKRKALDEAFWASPPARPATSPRILALLRPSENTEIYTLP
jgi:hypothetical protein